MSKIDQALLFVGGCHLMVGLYSLLALGNTFDGLLLLALSASSVVLAQK